MQFHRRLIEREFGRGAVQLLRVRNAQDAVGYLYNFVRDGHVYAYQSGFNYSDDPKRKPGLVTHALAVRVGSELGFSRYDFLAGDSQYKRSLATDEDQMVWLCLQNPRLRFSVERAARGLSGLGRRLRRAVHPQAPDRTRQT